MRKKLFSLAMAAILVLSFSACASQTVSEDRDTTSQTETETSLETTTEVSTGTSVEETTDEKTETSTEEVSEASTETTTETSTETSTETEKEKPKVPLYFFTDRTSQIAQTEATVYASNLKIGWNLGNTFDAKDGSSGLSYETYWQGAKTTPELMQALKDAGFNTIRIPVSWHNHVDSNNKIDAAWMARVKEVVDYCIDRDMYVILNTHHDVSNFFIYPSNKYRDQSNKYLKDIWTQVAEEFKDYGDKLMFESMNEVRLVGASDEWYVSGSAECKEAIDCINDYNNTFVQTVRNSGGNNATRFLVIPGYVTAPDGILDAGFKIPEDSSNADPHIILTVHSYAPYSFALESPGVKTWSSKNSSDTSQIESWMVKIFAKYVKNGIPVIIDEFGSQDKGNTDARVDHAGYFVGLAKSYGMTCVWWDNHNMTNSGEKFTIINRKTMQITFPEIVERMMAVLED